MCRTVTPTGQEQSACVACQSPCIDIDAERSYWDSVDQPDRRLLYYGYPGLVFGFYFYYYLYAGNWDYYFSGAWTHEENQLATLLDPGFYLMGMAIPIPKLAAVPLTIGLCIVVSYILGLNWEKGYKAYLQRSKHLHSKSLIRHRLFTLSTFGVFNLFFVFGGRPMLRLLPGSLQYLFNALILLTSTLWLYRTWRRSSERYLQEKLAAALRKQLNRLELDVSQFLDGRSLNDLAPGEIYVLAKVLPGFTQEKRRQVYLGVLKEALDQSGFQPSKSLKVFQSLRQGLGISETEHNQLLDQLRQQNPSLFAAKRGQSSKSEATIKRSFKRNASEVDLTMQRPFSRVKASAIAPKKII